MIIFNKHTSPVLIGPGGQRRGQRTIDETEEKRDHLEMGSQWKLWSWEVRNVVTKGGYCQT